MQPSDLEIISKGRSLYRGRNLKERVIVVAVKEAKDYLAGEMFNLTGSLYRPSTGCSATADRRFCGAAP